MSIKSHRIVIVQGSRSSVYFTLKFNTLRSFGRSLHWPKQRCTTTKSTCFVNKFYNRKSNHFSHLLRNPSATNVTQLDQTSGYACSKIAFRSAARRMSTIIIRCTSARIPPMPFTWTWVHSDCGVIYARRRFGSREIHPKARWTRTGVTSTIISNSRRRRSARNSTMERSVTIEGNLVAWLDWRTWPIRVTWMPLCRLWVIVHLWRDISWTADQLWTLFKCKRCNRRNRSWPRGITDWSRRCGGGIEGVMGKWRN